MMFCERFGHIGGDACEAVEQEFPLLSGECGRQRDARYLAKADVAIYSPEKAVIAPLGNHKHSLVVGESIGRFTT